MEISKPILGAVAALCVVAGVGAAHLLRSDRAVAAADSAAALPGVEASEAMVTAVPDVEPTQAPAAEPSSPIRPARDARTAERAPRPSTRAAASAPAPAPILETPRAADPTREVASTSQVPAEPVAAAEPALVAPAAPVFEELVVDANAVIGLEVETSISSERARVEDAVVAQVTRDVKVGSRVAIPSGAKAHGEVTLVDRGGRMKDRARLGVRFTSIVLADGTRVPIETDTIVREGSSPGGESSAKIGGGALGGAIIGGILGGAKGAIIGGSAGAGAGTAAVMAGGRNAATLSSGTPVTVRLLRPTTVTVEK